MIACNRGDVVLVGFVFSDESGRKLRPRCCYQLRCIQPCTGGIGRVGHYKQRQTASLWRSFDRQLEGGRIAISFPGDRDLKDYQADND